MAYSEPWSPGPGSFAFLLAFTQQLLSTSLSLLLLFNTVKKECTGGSIYRTPTLTVFTVTSLTHPQSLLSSLLFSVHLSPGPCVASHQLSPILELDSSTRYRHPLRSSFLRLFKPSRTSKGIECHCHQSWTVKGENPPMVCSFSLLMPLRTLRAFPDSKWSTFRTQHIQTLTHLPIAPGSAFLQPDLNCDCDMILSTVL